MGECKSNIVCIPTCTVCNYHSPPSFFIRINVFYKSRRIPGGMDPPRDAATVVATTSLHAKGAVAIATTFCMNLLNVQMHPPLVVAASFAFASLFMQHGQLPPYVNPLYA